MALVPMVTDLRKAIQLYYSRIELTNNDIKSLFGIKGQNVVNRLKDKAIEKMEEKKCPRWDAKTVNTECAYEAWGLNIADLEKRYAKLQKLGLLETIKEEQ